MTWNRITPSWHFDGYMVCAYLPGHRARLFPAFVGAIDATGVDHGGTSSPITIFQVTLPYAPRGDAWDATFDRVQTFLDVCVEHGITPPEMVYPYKPDDVRPYRPVPTIAQLLAGYRRFYRKCK